MPNPSFSRRCLTLLVALLALVSSAAAANVTETVNIIQTNAVPLNLWIILFFAALALLLISIRPGEDPEIAVFTASLAVVFSGASTYLITLVRDTTYEIVPVVNATTGAVIDHVVQPVSMQYEIPGIGWVAFLLTVFSVISLFSAYLAMVRIRRDGRP